MLDITFSKEVMADIAYNDCPEGFEKIEDKIIDHSRWSVIHQMIFSHNNKFYSSTYSVGATEQQDEGAYEYAPAEVKCQEVKQVERVIKVWENVNA